MREIDVYEAIFWCIEIRLEREQGVFVRDVLVLGVPIIDHFSERKET